MKTSMSQIQKKLVRLQETTFINEIFRISAVDEIGTIGGLRLGRTQKNTEVTWDEINAALGQIAYLLVVLAHRLGYSFEIHELHVKGAFSKISRKDKSKEKFDLYRENGEVSFNKGMKELLTCVGLFIANQSPQYPELIRSEKLVVKTIVGDKIDCCSIEYLQNKDQWTRACKALLTNLSFLQTLCKLKEESQQKISHQNDMIYGAQSKK